jgi:hypothetical protein
MAPGGGTAPTSDEASASTSPSSAARGPLATAAWIAVGLLALAAGSLALRGTDAVADVPLVEDAYYAFTASNNVAAGNGPTIDGEHLTNGFQPLFTFATAPAFFLDDTTALRVLLLVQALVLTATALLLGIVVRDAVDPRSPLVVPVVALLYLSAAFLTRASLSGLETGFLLFMYVLWWRTYQRRGMDSTVDAALLGLVAGFTVLARIDAVFVVAIFALVLWLRADDRVAAFRRSVLFGLVAVVVSSPWWLYNVLEFGSPVPTSGAAQQDVAFDLWRYDDAVGALGQAVVPWFSFGDRFADGRVLAFLPIGVAVVLWVTWLRTPRQDDAGPTLPSLPDPALLRRTDTFAVVLVLATAALALWYVTSSWAVHFYGRYLTLLVLPALYLWTRFFLALLARAPRLAVVGAAALVLVGAVSTLSYWSGSLGGGNTNLDDQLVLVERTVPADEVVAAGQSGTLGFYRDHVLNLDGKVNAVAYEQRDDIAGYLDDEGVDWICDWPGYVMGYVGDDTEAAGWEVVDRQGEFACYRRIDSGPSSS